MFQNLLLISGIFTTNPEPFSIDSRAGLFFITWLLTLAILFFTKKWINKIDEKIDRMEERQRQCREELPEKYQNKVEMYNIIGCLKKQLREQDKKIEKIKE